MLLQFTFKNYKSFADETNFDLNAANIKEHQNTLLEKNGNKILPAAAFFGANASGKSNFFLAFATMREIVLSSGQNKLYRVVPYFFNLENFQLPTEFQVCINIGEVEYRYGFECDKKEIASEWLFKKPFVKGTRAKEKLVFYRERGKSDTQYGKMKIKELKELEYANNMATKDQLLLNIIGNRGIIEFSNIFQWFNDSFIFNFANLQTEKLLNDVNIEFLYHNPKIKSAVELLINNIDPSILKLEIKKEQDENLNDKYKCVSVHNIDPEGEVRVPFEIESSGTKKILALAVGLFLTLSNGNPYFVDELDAKLHPLLVRHIVQMYTDKTINTNNAQLVFSAHNIICLDSSDLRRDEIWFIEKNKQKSELFSLYDFKVDDTNIRSDLSFGKHYIAGRFGAVPFQNTSDEVL